MLDRVFKLAENKTSVKTEVMAGLTTFLTMSYIIFVHPAVLSHDFSGHPTGLDAGAVLLATCLASAFTSLFMGLYAKYPIALAPGMGENFFFVTVVMALAGAGVSHAWQTALGIVFVAGILFLLISLFNIRRMIINAISPSLRIGIAAGIGLFIAFIGLRNGGIVVGKPGTLVGFTGHFFSVDTVVCLAGLVTASALWARGIRGSLLWGISVAALLSLALGKTHYAGLFGFPHIAVPAAFQLDLRSALTITSLPFIIIFLFMQVFDTTGTLLAVGQQGGFLKDGAMSRTNEVFVVDAAGTVLGALLGTSTVNAYIESTTGIAYGGRTGLTAVTAGVLFILALFFSPLIGMIATYPPITSCALIMVGALMAASAGEIAWSDMTESIPAFLILIGIPLSYSIADGIALGIISYPVIKVFSGRGKDVHPALYAVAALLVGYFAFIR